MGGGGRKKKRGQHKKTLTLSSSPTHTDSGIEDPIPLPNVSGKIMSKVSVCVFVGRKRGRRFLFLFCASATPTHRTPPQVLEYCKFHAKATPPGPAPTAEGAPHPPPAPPAGERVTDDEVKDYDADFVKVDQSTLFELILASNYLNIKPLLDLSCLTVANMIKGKTPEEIRKTFNIPNDFTPEEEEEVRRENQWAFE